MSLSKSQSRIMDIHLRGNFSCNIYLTSLMQVTEDLDKKVDSHLQEKEGSKEGIYM